MKWTKLRSSLRARFSSTIARRVDIHQARYRRTREEVGRVWFSVDGEEIASFDTSSYMRQRAEIGDAIREANSLRPYGTREMERAYLDADDAAQAILRKDGAQDDYHAVEEMEAFLSMSITRALESDSPLLRGLAILDGRVGKRRLQALAAKAEHPLVRAFLALRLEAEGLRRGMVAV